MFDDLIDSEEEEISIEHILADSGIGKCGECNFYQIANGLCQKIIKIVHPDQVGCLDFIEK
jgi:hypothetical protein